MPTLQIALCAEVFGNRVVANFSHFYGSCCDEHGVTDHIASENKILKSSTSELEKSPVRFPLACPRGVMALDSPQKVIPRTANLEEIRGNHSGNGKKS